MKEQRYEISYHIIPTLDDAGVQAVVEKVRATIEKHEGAIVEEHQPEQFSLAYKLVKHQGGKNEKFDSSKHGFLRFTAKTDAAHLINQEMRAVDGVLRYLLIQIPKEVRETRRMQTSVQTPHAAPAGTDEKEAMSKEEMDKEIEKLVVD